MCEPAGQSEREGGERERERTTYHAVLRGVFEHVLIVFRQRRDENDRRHAFETMNPFLAFVPLASNVIHFEDVALDRVPFGDDARRPHARIDDVLFVGHVLGRLDDVHFLHVEAERFEYLVLGTTSPNGLHDRIAPERFDGLADAVVDRFGVVDAFEHVKGIFGSHLLL